MTTIFGAKFRIISLSIPGIHKVFLNPASEVKQVPLGYATLHRYAKFSVQIFIALSI